MAPTALVLGSSASDLAPALQAELTKRGYQAFVVVMGSGTDATINPQSRTLKDDIKAIVESAVAKGPLRIVVLASEDATKEPRANVANGDMLDDQFKRLIDGDLHCQMLFAATALPHLLKSAVAHVDPSHIMILGSRLTRLATSPGQALVAASKRALQSFGGSLFFEWRTSGLKVATTHPGPERIQPQHMAAVMFMALDIGPTACLEALEVATVVPSRLALPSPLFRGCMFVTGGSKGIGRSIALALCEKFRMPVALVGRDAKSLADASAECAAFVPRDHVMTFAFDVRDNARMKKAVDETAARFGAITVLVCSAGINRRRWSVAPDGKKFADPKLWQELMDINVSSTMCAFLATGAPARTNAPTAATGYALPHMLRGTTSEGVAPCVLFVGSRIVRTGGAPGQQSYAASKMALAGFSQSIHYEVRAHGIRTCCLNVGIVATDLGSRGPSGGSFGIAKTSMLIQPSDVSAACVNIVGSPAYVNVTAIDMSGTSPEFLSNDGESLRMTKL